jgi:anti-sigma regulatory factor (Ser/Thr protein kinase)
MDNDYISLHYKIISGDYIKGGEASSNVKKALMQLGIRSDLIKRICIACYESEMNMVIHSLGGYIDVNIFEDCIEITATDFGPGIENIDLAMTEGFSTASEEAREMGFGSGMGLPNIKKSCSFFEIHSIPGESTTVKMKIEFKNTCL